MELVMKKMSYIIAFIPLIISCRPNYERVQVLQVSGKVDSLYISWNHAMKTMVVDNMHYELIYWLDENDALWEYIEVGDSVSKPKGSTTLQVIKGEGKQRDFVYVLHQ